MDKRRLDPSTSIDKQKALKRRHDFHDETADEKRANRRNPADKPGGLAGLEETGQQERAEHLSIGPVIHRVLCSQRGSHKTHEVRSYYLDAPRLRKGDNKTIPLRGEQPITDLEKFIEDESLPFFFFKDYGCDDYLAEIKDSFVRILPRELDPQVFQDNRDFFYILTADVTPPQSSRESLEIKSPALQSIIAQIVSENPDLLRDWQNKRNKVHPYPFFFHHRDAIRDIALKRLDSTLHQLISPLLNSIEGRCRKEYDEASDLFSQGMVTRQHLGKVFRLSDIVITLEDNEPRGLVIDEINEGPDGVLLQAWSYVFDGRLSKRVVDLEVNWPATKEDEAQLPTEISNLSACPLRYDNQGKGKDLLRRGIEFWSCRKRRFVTYLAPRRPLDVQAHAPRFMIDFDMFRDLHQKEPEDERQSAPTTSDAMVPPEVMDKDEPDDPNFFLLLPSNVFGFSMKDKKWRNLQIKYIQPVPWNTKAFERLVLDHRKKELIEALVSVHLENNRSNDIIEGKGNGLIILLHGGPGTGKTLTAESVAELAGKPLYRVTCGDIGTEPENVEQYLESVLKIGTIWDCVVLLDEADVFLEERTPQDLQRNALVSVFLRILEYYEGILILTTNRVGTFDEAFKSRVQLAVYYPALDTYGRRQIWRDALRSMQSEHVKFDLSALLDRVDQLAKHKLNGRQIRNTIRSALQLAHFRRQTLSYQHFEQTVNVTLEFETYVEKTHRHTADEWAVEQGTRADEAELKTAMGV